MDAAASSRARGVTWWVGKSTQRSMPPSAQASSSDPRTAAVVRVRAYQMCDLVAVAPRLAAPWARRLPIAALATLP